MTSLRCTLAAVALLATAGAHSAMVEHQVWYDDDIFFTYDYGDVSSGFSTPLVPPDWACGRRYFDPSWYRWRDQYTGTISSGDFWTDIHVWLPLGGGCPHNQIVVERKDGSQTYAAPSGTHLLSIYSHYGSYWINSQGGWPACTNCGLGSGYLQVATRDRVWAQLVDTLVQSLVLPVTDGQRQLAHGQRELAQLHKQLDGLMQQRRQKPFGKLEGTVRQLEDHALASTATAVRQADECARWMAGGATDSAHRACHEAGRSVEQARNAMRVIATELHQDVKPPAR